MKRKVLELSTVFALVWTLVTISAGAGIAGEAPTVTGKDITNFSLSSSQNRLVTYGNEYYGKHNLIITFFPAAFTPV
jgi:hypothetical protein